MYSINLTRQFIGTSYLLLKAKKKIEFTKNISDKKQYSCLKRE
jgi:hypothetical protein